MTLFAFIAINISCDKELYDDAISSSKKASIREVKFDELLKEQKFKNLLTTVSDNHLQRNASARSAFENQYGFTIVNSSVKVIETSSLTSYTMLIERDGNTNETFFENLVIQEDIFNNQKAAVFKYSPTLITPTYHNSFLFQGSIQKQNINNFSGFNRNSYENTTQSECYADVLMCNESWSGGSLGSEHTATGACRNINFLFVKRVRVICAGDSGGGGGGDFWDGSGSGDNGSGFGDTGGSGGGANDFPSDENNEIVTSPILTVNNPTPQRTPCQQLALMTMNFALKNALTDLKTKTGETREYGYKITKTNRTFNNPTPNNADPNNSNKIIMSAGGNNVGCFHTHDNPATNGTYPMFSPEDILYLLDIATYHNNNGQPKDFSEYFITLTVDGGTFALKIKDFLNFRRQMATNYEGKGGIKDKLEKDYYDFREPAGDINLLKKDFLTVTRNLGIGLYEASSDLSSWSEVVLDLNPISPTFSEPKNIPCN